MQGDSGGTRSFGHVEVCAGRPIEGGQGTGRTAMSSKKLGWKILLSGASLAAMGALGGTAYAQNNTTPPAADQNSDEIIVTATGRAAALQDVPVAVTAIGAGQV